MSDTFKQPGLPDLSAMMRVTELFEETRAVDPVMKDAATGELLRLVPHKRAVIEGQFQGQPAVFRMCLDPDSDTIALEWAEMRRLWPLVQTPNFGIAKPLHLSADHRIAVVEYVTGIPLLDHFRGMAPAGRAAFWPPVARWLRLATESTETWRVERHSGWLTRAERAAASQPFAELRSLEAAILSEMQRIGGLFQGTDWRVAICHGDYHPNNLISNGARLTAVDTGGSAQLPVYKDMARFLVHLARRGSAFRVGSTWALTSRGLPPSLRSLT